MEDYSRPWRTVVLAQGVEPLASGVSIRAAVLGAPHCWALRFRYLPSTSAATRRCVFFAVAKRLGDYRLFRPPNGDYFSGPTTDQVRPPSTVFRS